MTNKAFALHETMEMHELLTFKNVSMTKSTTMQVLVSDERLRGLLQTVAAVDRRHIQDLHSLLSGVSIETNYQGGVHP